jgi:hypothetical protein
MYATIDIETTGLTAHDKITAIGINLPEYFAIHYRTPNNHEDNLTPPNTLELKTITGNQPVVAQCHPSESELIKNTFELLDGSESPTLQGLAGFNSDNFDFPHLRTRAQFNGLDQAFPIDTYDTVDLAKVFRYKFNTNVIDCSGLNKAPLRKFGERIGAEVNTSMKKADLTEAVQDRGFERDELLAFAEETGNDLPTKQVASLHDLHLLLTDRHNTLVAFDPFEDSEEAVEAFQEGNLHDLACHNLVDIKMTSDLLELARKTVPAEEIKTRRL